MCRALQLILQLSSLFYSKNKVELRKYSMLMLAVTRIGKDATGSKILNLPLPLLSLISPISFSALPVLTISLSPPNLLPLHVPCLDKSLLGLTVDFGQRRQRREEEMKTKLKEEDEKEEEAGEETRREQKDESKAPCGASSFPHFHHLFLLLALILQIMSSFLSSLLF